MCDAAGLKSSLRTSHRSGTRDGASKSLPAALWRLLGRHVNSGRVRVGPDRDARMAAPQEVTNDGSAMPTIQARLRSSGSKRSGGEGAR